MSGSVLFGSIAGTMWAASALLSAASQPAAMQETQPAGRFLVVFVDDMHFAALESPQVRRILEVVRDQLVRDDDLVRITFTGFSSSNLVAYDRDRVRFSEAIRRTMGSASPPSATSTPTDTARRQRAAEIAIETATDAVRALEPMTNARKVLIYLSGGYPASESEVAKGLDALAQTAKRAGVVIYHIDPSRWGASPAPTSSSAVDKLAEATGGFRLMSPRDFARVQG